MALAESDSECRPNFCPECGSAIGEAARFCAKCGSAIQSKPRLVPQPTPPVTTAAAIPPSVKLSLQILGIAICVVVVAAIEWDKYGPNHVDFSSFPANANAAGRK